MTTPLKPSPQTPLESDFHKTAATQTARTANHLFRPLLRHGCQNCFQNFEKSKTKLKETPLSTTPLCALSENGRRVQDKLRQTEQTCARGNNRGTWGVRNQCRWFDGQQGKHSYTRHHGTHEISYRHQRRFLGDVIWIDRCADVVTTAIPHLTLGVHDSP